jgi:hypothetical protein
VLAAADELAQALVRLGETKPAEQALAELGGQDRDRWAPLGGLLRQSGGLIEVAPPGPPMLGWPPAGVVR